MMIMIDSIGLIYGQLHTDLGDIKIEVYCEAVPKTAENFLALCASGYYDNVLIHRNVCFRFSLVERIPLI